MSVAVCGRVELDRFALDVSLTAQPGDVVALVGPNGAGKTTMLRAVAGLLALASGSVTIGGSLVDEPSTGTWVPPHRRPVGFVFQDLRLFPHLNVVDNVAYGLRRRGVERHEARRRATDWLERIGIADLDAARPTTLSGGQAQRVALARALVLDPEVLLLDEPLSALDADARMAIRGELRRHLAAVRGTTLLIAHDLIDVVGLATRVVVLEEGRVAQDTTPAGLRQHPRTRHAAALVGMNLIRADRAGDSLVLPGGARVPAVEPGPDGPVDIVCSPRAVTVAAQSGAPPPHTWTSSITGLESVGDHARARLGPPVAVTARLPIEALQEGLALDAPVSVHLDPTQLRVFPVEVDPLNGHDHDIDQRIQPKGPRP